MLSVRSMYVLVSAAMPVSAYQRVRMQKYICIFFFIFVLFHYSYISKEITEKIDYVRVKQKNFNVSLLGYRRICFAETK